MKHTAIAAACGMTFSCLLASPFVLAADAADTTDSATTLDEVVVTADRKARSIDETLAPVTVITRKDIEKYQAQSLPEVLQRVPGVSLTNDGGMGKNTSVALRGTNASHVLVLVDGVKMGSATLGSVAWADLPLDNVERIEVVRGPRSSLYGSEAIGGVVQIFTRKGGKGFQPQITLGAGSHDTEKLNVNLAGGNAQTWYNLNAGKDKTNGFNAQSAQVSISSSFEPDNDGYDRDSVALHAGHRFNDKTQVEISALHAKGTNDFDGSIYSGNSSKFEQQMLSGKVQHQLNDKVLVSAQVGQSRDQSDYSYNGEPLTYGRTYNTRRQTASAQADVAIGQGSASVGVDQQNDRIESDSTYAQTARDNTGVFANYQTQVGQNRVDVSARHDDNEQFGKHNTGALALGRDIGNGLNVKASYGTAFKAPTFNDLYYPYGGNPDLTPEKSRNLELGVQGKLPQGRWEANAFQNTVDDLIAWTEDASGNWTPINVNKARIRGLELSAGTQVAGFDVNANATLQKPENRSAGNSGNTLIYRPKQIVNVDVDRRFGKVSVGATAHGESKRYTDAANTESLPGFGTLDLRSDYRLGKDWTVGAKIGNVLDKQYQTNQGYNQDGLNALVTLKYAPK